MGEIVGGGKRDKEDGVEISSVRLCEGERERQKG